MTTKIYAEIIRSADEMPAGLFAARWMLMPEAESIPGIDPADLDKTKAALIQLHKHITRPLADIRKDAGLSQQKLADRFAIPVATVRNWEQRDCCPIYIRLMMQEALGQWSPAADMGVQNRVCQSERQIRCHCPADGSARWFQDCPENRP